MNTRTWITVATLGVVLGAVAPLEAQGRGTSQRQSVDRDRSEQRDKDDDDDDHRYGDRQREGKSGSSPIYGSVSQRQGDGRDDRYERERNERGNGPSFCRNGRGHPRFGWSWCRERGWDRSGNSAVRWERRSWEDVVFRIPTEDRRRSLDRRGLGEVLGDVVFGRIDTGRREMGASTDYVGRWLTSGSGRELWITAGGVPIAKLVDRNGDRRVDSVYMAER